MIENIRTIENCIKDYGEYLKAKSRSQNNYLERRLEIPREEGTINIAVYPTGGMGDYIISSKLVDELLQYAPAYIDVFCENMVFGNAIYAQRPFMRVIEAEMYDDAIGLYDLAMKIEHFVHVNAYNPIRLRKLAPVLYKSATHIRHSWGKYYLNISDQCYRERIHFQQMKLLGLNRYTELRADGAFKISDSWTGVILNEEYKKDFEEEFGGRYITFGCDADSMNRAARQIKIWPMEYFEELLLLIKEKYPEIKTIQIGGKNSPRVANADYHLLGESLETIKWVLKKSICHIDCEGGLVHLATQLGTRCIVTFGPTPIDMYGYPQNINLINSDCNNCMGIQPNWAFECYRKDKEPRCIYGITPQMVMQHITEIITAPKDKDYISIKSCIDNIVNLVGSKNVELDKYTDEEKKIHDMIWTGSYLKVAIIGNAFYEAQTVFAQKGVQTNVYNVNYKLNNVQDFCDYLMACNRLGNEVYMASEFAIPSDKDCFDIIIKNDNQNINEAIRIVKNKGIIVLI